MTARLLVLVLAGACLLAGQPVDAALLVNGRSVSALEEKYLRFMAQWTVPNMLSPSGGSLPKDQKCTNAAYTAWWALKEGVLSEYTQGLLSTAGYPGGSVFGYSNCYNPKPTSVTVGPTTISARAQAVIAGSYACPAGHPSVDTGNMYWQLGIGAINYQADAAAAEGLALKVYKAVWGRTPTINEVLSTTLTQAGFASSSAVWKAVMATVGRTDEASVILRRSWLLRNHVVGTILSAPRNSGCQYLSSCTVVDPRTREQKQHFCCGAWEQAAKFAGSPAAIKASIADLKRFFCSRF